MTLEQGLDAILADEGGYSDRADDRGGPTNHGITIPALTDYLRGTTGNLRAVAVREDIRALSIDNAREWYRWKAKRLLWRIANEDLVYVLLDAATRMGDRAGVKLLQRAVEQQVDGVLGPITAAAIPYRDPRRLCSLVCIEEMLFNDRLAAGNLTDADRDGVPDYLEALPGWSARLAKKHRRYA